MKRFILGGAVLAALVSLPAGAQVRYRVAPSHRVAPYYRVAPYGYSPPITSPFHRGSSYLAEPDPFIRGQLLRDLPEGKQPPS